MRQLTSGAEQRFALNVASNACYAIVNMVLMLWYVPFLIRHLGVAAYGAITLANTLVMYATILTAGFDVTTNRFLALSLNRNDRKTTDQIFNAVFLLSVIISATLFIIFLVAAYFIPRLFNLPEGLEGATQLLFGGVATTMLAGILGGGFGAISVIMHRFELRNLVRALTSVSRVGVVAVCFSIYPASLWHVALGFVVSAIIALAGDVIVARHLAPELRLKLRSIDLQQLRALADLGSWAAVNQAGNLLLLQVDLLIINALFGAEATGQYGPLLLLVALIHTMTETLVSVLSPIVMTHYAVGNRLALQRVASCSVRLLGVGLALPIGLLCGLGGPLLQLWLGPDFAGLNVLLILLVGHLAVTLSCRPLAYVLMAHNRIRLQSLVTLASGLAAVPLAVMLAQVAGWGMAGVAAATAIVWSIKNVIFLAPYAAKILGTNWGVFFSSFAIIVCSTLGVGVASSVLCHYWSPSSWVSLGVVVGVIALAYMVVGYAISLRPSDRKVVWSILQPVRRQLFG
ncbi:oligosaccharide flippase family protein [Belnapia sp. T6]|uniref:Oligosaccharide flippase family protein n=1 Tax=Belnapia mucosa TaxID=2804532 RepID=A0ABS1VD29_9PROT|nr:oligosaccharide flippase family protein [Belnapia mucosa]MBL6459586.1 oligosaccharide flippase family protein [Belnapia mucosa]